MFKWLRRPAPVTIQPAQIDVSQLDHSMNLLRSTAEEVSQAAVCAAKTLEEQLQFAELRFNSTIDHITDLVIVKDHAGRWKKLNKIGQEAFGWWHGEFYDKTDAELAQTFPHFKPTLDQCQLTDKQTWECRKSYRIEETIPDGVHYRVFDVVKTPVFNDDGTPKELIVIGRDVTEIREKQRRTKACFHALNSASDVIAIVDKQFNIFFCNDKFTEAFGLHDYNTCVGKPLENVVGKNVSKSMWKTVQQNKTWTGKFDNYQLTVLPMMNGEPKPIYYVCTFKAINNSAPEKD